MITTISPSRVTGKIKAPPSKSSMQRACAAALLTPGTTIIDNFGNSNDERVAINIITRLGAEVNIINNKMAVTSSEYIFNSPFTEKNVLINCGESGLSMRMFTPIAALFNYAITFTGEGSILKRPMNFFDENFPFIGVEINSNGGKIPITIRGPLQPKNITVNGSMSSQFLTGLLFSYAKACKVPVSIRVENLLSRPYIDLTISVLSSFGFQVYNENYETFIIKPRKPLLNHSIKYTVEGDWSNAAFLLVAGAVSGEIILNGTNLNSAQGDKKIIEAIYSCGAEVRINKDEITVKKKDLTSFDFDATHCPDLFPPLVALAAYCKGTSTIKGVNRLLFKESNRALTLKNEFKKMSVDIELNGDYMTIKGGKEIKGAKVSSHNDHRIAMACAIAALGAKGNTIIENAEAVNKSYPDFYKNLKQLNVQVTQK
ncbi:MAG: 3-phosphoshikimate 1-carboxyvinyltransferase [Ginsengibacter sp.]